ncbi:tRNA (N6-threonylcarbamoyladenosine(37)-N6)-methyltransferase TrmO [Desulfobacterales bacterium HSG16]|nr:tRNA (N6-threonylcarbamoyladenosine(37)-N6)-methyltransferase TrmO [Desulfobacterales bacterium HSG16]
MIETIEYRPIGLVHSPFKTPEGTPIQPPAAAGIRAEVEIMPEFVEALKDLEGFSHIILLYHFHRAGAFKPVVKPFLDDSAHGLFATRAPARPNPIGLSVVRLVSVDKNRLIIEDADIVDNSPVLDIKPYAPVFDVREESVKTGWLETGAGWNEKTRDDGRFAR